MIIFCLEQIDEFDKIDFLIREEAVGNKTVSDFFKKHKSDKIENEGSIIRAELFVTKEKDEIIIRHSHESKNTWYTVLTGGEARAFMAMLAPELENRAKSIGLLQKIFLTKSAPPPEIELPKKKGKANAWRQ